VKRHRVGQGKRARRRQLDEVVLVRPKFIVGFPKGPGHVYDIANGKYEIRWPNGDSGWFSSSDLRDAAPRSRA